MGSRKGKGIGKCRRKGTGKSDKANLHSRGLIVSEEY